MLIDLSNYGCEPPMWLDVHCICRVWLDKSMPEIVLVYDDFGTKRVLKWNPDCESPWGMVELICEKINAYRKGIIG